MAPEDNQIQSQNTGRYNPYLRKRRVIFSPSSNTLQTGQSNNTGDYFDADTDIISPPYKSSYDTIHDALFNPSPSTPGPTDDAIDDIFNPPSSTPGATDDAIDDIFNPPSSTSGATDDAIDDIFNPPSLTPGATEDAIDDIFNPSPSTPGATDDAIDDIFNPPSSTPGATEDAIDDIFNSSTSLPSNGPVDDAMRSIYRSGSPAEVKMDSLNITNLENDGSYTNPGDTGKYYWQPNDTVFYTGGERNGENTPSSTHTGDAWDENLNIPLPWTIPIANLDLIPNDDGSYKRVDPRDKGNYYLQSDGSIWYEGGVIKGREVDPQTYANDNWDKGRKKPISGTVTIANLRLTPTQSGTWLDPDSENELSVKQLKIIEKFHLQKNEYGCYSALNDPRFYFLQDNGSVFTPGGGSDLNHLLPGGTYTNGKWAEDPRTLQGSAFLITKLGLLPSPDGTFYNPSKPERTYIPQKDGSIFLPELTYSTINGQKVPQTSLGPVTFHSGRWDLNRDMPISGESFIKAFGLVENLDGSLSRPGIQGTYHRLLDDKLLYKRPDNTEWIFTNGSWNQFIKTHD